MSARVAEFASTPLQRLGRLHGLSVIVFCTTNQAVYPDEKGLAQRRYDAMRKNRRRFPLAFLSLRAAQLTEKCAIFFFVAALREKMRKSIKGRKGPFHFSEFQRILACAVSSRNTYASFAA